MVAYFAGMFASEGWDSKVARDTGPIHDVGLQHLQGLGAFRYVGSFLGTLATHVIVADEMNRAWAPSDVQRDY